ncbi:Calmodulin [Cytospora mali]|uniref:Calmodulin n=1 Tax=Cytospora mali TaxID=578113 RepID=A0A194VAC8_CYTMA|nr:Calmodulin [Valsa mali var. pyri (nom. inval.)]
MVRTAPRYLPATTKQLSAEEIAIFKDCFNEYDTDQGGNITVEEFARVMRKTTPSISDEEVSKIVSEVDLDEFITMMTGQPYKSPEPAAATTGEKKTEIDGTLNITVSSAAAVRGVSAVSAKLQRQRLANQIYKDAWMEIDPSLKGSITPTELKQVAAKTGLVTIVFWSSQRDRKSMTSSTKMASGAYPKACPRIFDRSTANLLMRLDLEAVRDEGYTNLAVNPGQQQPWLAPCHDHYKQAYNATEMSLRPEHLDHGVAFKENFGITNPGFVLTSPCSSKLAVSKDTIRKVPRSQFQHHIDWLIANSDDPQSPVKIFEGEDDYKGYWDLLDQRDMTLQESRAMATRDDAPSFDKTLTDYLTADNKVDRAMAKAIERGADAFYRLKVGNSRALL